MTGKNKLRILPILGNTDENAVETAFKIPSVQNDIDPDFWCITNNINNKRIFDLAFEYVQKGSKVIGGLPQLSFGNLTTIDRQEIEAYQNIRNLILGYIHSDNVRPLSIAVFGAPGSGKSFGVTEIAKNILPGKVEKVEFNVSQFTDNAELGAAFQKVRDITLSGKLPLVFFDEFDSDKLRWLKSFLMPMQDGKFKDESGEHPLGKCILVFAGGTSANFEQFTRPMTSENAEEQKTFRDLKVPDFISRLRGTINVLGPNQQSENDKNYMLRRALLLRSLCERKMKLKKDKETQINENILWAMLLIPTYKYGARSMESIFDMSCINGQQWEAADLPFHSQLSLHVDADAFIRLVLRNVILNSYKEKLAIAIHEDFCLKNPDSDNNIPWTALPEDVKDSNRDQAHCFGEYLTVAGYDFDSGDTPFPSIKKFTGDELLKIARLSHEIWIKSKTDAGWIHGNVKNAVNKTHPLLTEWEQLPEEEKLKDLDIAENIIPLMESVGLRIYRVI
ncbi:MAG: AAA family ATPase [Tannerella sp.]|nr:AAA family ATPase [Tannerella sp.]